MTTPVLSHVLCCSCGARAGFTCVNQWWICASCRLPAYGYLQAVIDGSASYNRHGSEESAMSKDGIILFEGGPNDGQTYFTKDLLGHKSLTIPITDYVWTSETKTSEKTGAVAQIWRFKGLVDAASPVAAAAAPAPIPAPVATPVSTVTEEPAVIVGPADAVAAISHVDSPAADGVVGGDAPAAATEPVSGGPVATDALPSGEELQRRRKALKVSVGVVGDKAGLAHSKVASIEKGTGKRVKPEEIRAVLDAVVALEAERGGVSAH